MDIAETPAIIALFLVANCGEDCQMSVARCMRDILEWNEVNYAYGVLKSPRIPGLIYTPKWEEIILDWGTLRMCTNQWLDSSVPGKWTYSDGASDRRTNRILSKYHFRSINSNGSSADLEIQTSRSLFAYHLPLNYRARLHRKCGSVNAYFVEYYYFISYW